MIQNFVQLCELKLYYVCVVLKYYIISECDLSKESQRDGQGAEQEAEQGAEQGAEQDPEQTAYLHKNISF